MKNCVFIYAADISEYVLKPVLNGKNSLECVLEFATGLPDADKTIVLTSAELPVPENFENIRKQDWSPLEFIQTIREHSNGYENVFILFADTPLLNRDITTRMYKNHKNYLAEYTFADGYPMGIAPEIIRCEILEALEVLAKKVPGTVAHGTLFSIVEKDINSFDVETEISPQDLRLYRVSLTADNSRNFKILSRFIEQNAIEEEQIIDVIQNKQAMLRSTPAYFALQITGGCPQSCTFCPYPQMNPGLLTDKREMAFEDFQQTLQKISTIAEDAYITLSLWGEPSLHSGIAAFAAEVISYPGFRLIIETSGVGWKQEDVDAITALKSDRITWIISLETNNQGSYKKLRGQGRQEAVSLTEKLHKEIPDNVYVQAIRLKETETDLEEFYRHWHAKTEHVIIQKYDHFSGKLPQRKVTDLSPLKRQACWHMKRDFHILLNGDIPLCREDISGEHLLGNIFTDPITEIWEKGHTYYLDHLQENYLEMCRNCDEYYTYNF